MCWGRARCAIAALLVLPVLAASGCGEGERADRSAGAGETARPATPADLELTAEAVGLQAEGGLPARVRLTVRNRSSGPVSLALPRPLIDEQTAGEIQGPLVVLGVRLLDAAGREECAVYSHPRDKAPEKPRTVVMPVGGSWPVEYPLAEFYFWGPCGPDTGGNFTCYFWRGDKEITLFALLVFGKDQTLQSNPIALRCRSEEWLFRKD
jgi:hypothetical protein